MLLPGRPSTHGVYLLAQRGCDLGQGYWLSHPVTATEAVRMIDSGV